MVSFGGLVRYVRNVVWNGGHNFQLARKAELFLSGTCNCSCDSVRSGPLQVRIGVEPIYIGKDSTCEQSTALWQRLDTTPSSMWAGDSNVPEPT